MFFPLKALCVSVCACVCVCIHTPIINKQAKSCTVQASK